VSTRDLTDPRVATGWTLSDTEQSIPRRFADQVRRYPGKTAIAGTSWQPTFEQLDAAANGIAHALLDLNGGGRGRIAVLMDHGAPLTAAMLGVLKAGHAIAVLNPVDPPGRLDSIRRGVEPHLALVDGRHREVARRAGFTELLDTGVASARAEQPDVEIDGDELAAVMFTSGSTGRPKGVMQTHHTLLHTALRHVAGLGLQPDDRVALLASPSGGHGMGTTWMTLLSGATLCPFPVMDRGVVGLPEWLREHRITVLGLSASLFRRLVRSLDGSAFPDLRLVRLGSEQVRRADFDACRRHLGEGCGFANVFSLTEAGGIAHGLLAPGEEPPAGPLPAGWPAPGIDITLVDERGNPVPAGEPGEIAVSSRHLSPGYWRNQELTAERFSTAAGNGERILRTGDLGRFNEDGALIILGRRDTQVKIRGYRVELDEIEAALCALPQVAAAVVLADPTRHGDPRLTAYVAPRDDADPGPAELRDSLRMTLPEASIPTAIALVDELPLNAHGKVDHERLAELSPRSSSGGSESTVPSAESERRLSEIWADALELERVGIADDFFDLGGDSLTAAEIGAGVYETFGVEIDMRAFTRHPTVAEMAALVSRLRTGRRGGPAQPEPVPRDGPLPCSFAQERIWRYRETNSYSVSSVARLHGPIDVEALRAALAHLVRRHEPLRTTFAELDGHPVQIVQPPGPPDVPLLDVSGAPDPEERVLELWMEQASEPFDLEHGPLHRFSVVRVSEGDHRLLRIGHHLISDRHSWRIFFDELIAAYEAIREGKRPPDGVGRLQYADFAAWERHRLRPEGRLYREQVAWWSGELDRSPRLRLPFARQTPASGLSPDEGATWWGIDPEVAATLERVARDEGATHFALHLGLFSALLALEGSQDVIPLGAYVDTRRRPETRGMFGYFTNLVTLILPFDPEAPLRAWIRKVRYILAEATAHSDLPYEQLCEELRAAGFIPPEIKAIFSVWTPMPEATWLTAVQIPLVERRVMMPWGFTFTVDQTGETGGGYVSFDAHLHDRGEVRRFIDLYTGLAEATAAAPDRPLGELHRALR
jgi:amino acid adenylation domain-containing protein